MSLIPLIAVLIDSSQDETTQGGLKKEILKNFLEVIDSSMYVFYKL